MNDASGAELPAVQAAGWQALTEAIGAELRAPGFPAEIIDHKPETPGQEIPIGIGPRTLEKEKQMTMRTKTIAAWHHTKRVARTTANGSREVAISLWHKWQTRRKCELCGLNKVGSYMSDLTQLVPYDQSWTDEDGHHEDAGYSHPQNFYLSRLRPTDRPAEYPAPAKGAEKTRDDEGVGVKLI